LHPSVFVILQWINESVCLLHLLLSFVCFLLEGILFSHLSIILGLKTSLEGLDLFELFLSCS
jgi:hypothetical protein